MTLAVVDADLIFKSVTAAVTLGGAGFALFKYRQELINTRIANAEARERDREIRKDDLAWRKTQFLLQLAQDFDKDERFQRAVQLIDTNSSSLKRSLRSDPRGLTAADLRSRYAIDRYLDFFDRLCSFVDVTKALSIKDIACFSGFLDGIAQNKHVHSYAEDNGYHDVLVLNDRFPFPE